ncbi:MAG: Pup--protein ligase, partial [Anaerolineaceae bacterium]|nr:Pup--protein ligase [Anaerolineaceae bacterium]
ALVRTVGGPAVSAVAVQREYWQRAAEHLRDHGPARPLDTQVVELWDRALTAVETGDWAPVAADIDWVIKHRLLARHAQRHGLDSCGNR